MRIDSSFVDLMTGRLKLHMVIMPQVRSTGWKSNVVDVDDVMMTCSNDKVVCVLALSSLSVHVWEDQCSRLIHALQLE